MAAVASKRGAGSTYKRIYKQPITWLQTTAKDDASYSNPTGIDRADYLRTERRRPCMDDGADHSTDVLIVLIMQRPPPNARRQFRLVCLTALAAAHRHAHLHDPSQPRRDARHHQEASASTSLTTIYHLQLQQSDAARRCASCSTDRCTCCFADL
jgi:hypothetical protein